MEQINQKWNRIMELFFEEPSKQLTIREISKQTKIPSTSVQRYVTNLKKQGLITDKNKANITQKFKSKKIIYMLDKIENSGLIDFIEKNNAPAVIVLFGSARKGEFEKESDIDLYIESSKKQKINLAGFEKKLKHKIQLFIYPNTAFVPAELRQNIINGIKLRGFLKIIKV